MSKEFEVDISLEVNFHAVATAKNENEAYELVLTEIEKILEERKIKKGLSVECDFHEATWSDVNEIEVDLL